MELPEAPKTDSKPLEQAPSPVNESLISAILDESLNTEVDLPKDAGVSLRKLPPPRDSQFLDLSPPGPARPLVAERKAKVFPRGSLPPAVRRQREPKFVPYEPYKAAVASMGPGAGGLSRGRGPSQDSQLSRSLHSPAALEEAGDRLPGRAETPEAEINREFERNYGTMLELKEREIECLKAQVESAEKQLKIQTKVNMEVKKLLVASVGEDIEARVDFLTQDKARLAADVIQYNNRIATDFEEKEALGVESDVWKSKFLASTVIVQELRTRLESVLAREHQVEHLARRVLQQGGQVRDKVGRAQAEVDRMNKAFDPLSKMSVSAPRDLDLVSGCEHLRQSVEA